MLRYKLQLFWVGGQLGQFMQPHALGKTTHFVTCTVQFNLSARMTTYYWVCYWVHMPTSKYYHGSKKIMERLWCSVEAVQYACFLQLQTLLQSGIDNQQFTMTSIKYLTQVLTIPDVVMMLASLSLSRYTSSEMAREDSNIRSISSTVQVRFS